MDFFTAMEVSASGLGAQRVRMNVASSNLANVSTTSANGGGPYVRKNVTVAVRPGRGRRARASAGSTVRPASSTTLARRASSTTPVTPTPTSTATSPTPTSTRSRRWST
jgi:flagellar basal-body rod protein FlgC